ncbi:hypothetical protein P1X15_08765 [Runella sp. MFBS21]|uniref:hypothetical protein n=1 Tax=Runella sp. MFBS21 TaxID=3034018 RepID=UPI0023F906C2|nr:hypothetical protein [Runella sp. MFBS21]MDF7817686.1 hypothetical protein [Runella sp. MFBS21]
MTYLFITVLMVFFLWLLFSPKKKKHILSSTTPNISSKNNQFILTEDIDNMAKIILKEQYQEFADVISLLITEKEEAYKKLSKLYRLFKDFENEPVGSLDGLLILIEVATKFKKIVPVDWSGEYNENDLKNHILLNLDNTNLSWTNYETLEERFLDATNGYGDYDPKGRFLQHQFDELIKILKPIHANLLNLNDFGDQYNLFLASDSDLKQLDKYIQKGEIIVIEDIVNATKQENDWKNI